MATLDSLPDAWDLIVIGGGITGAGILLEAGQRGLRTLLLERNDFAWGASSRSTKLIHGGFRYLREGNVGLTWASVEERERLLREAPGLVEKLGFLLPVYRNQDLGRWSLGAGFALYDLIARKWDHRFYDSDAFCMLSPHIRRDRLMGGFQFFDAQADDARLVMRLIQEARQCGDHVQALNYAAAKRITRNAIGRVSGVEAIDSETGVEKMLKTRVVINAAGSWAEALHPPLDRRFHMRPLRGSHLLFPMWVLPTEAALSFFHPADGRPMAIIPWEGALLVGTTDIDHKGDLLTEPAITPAEVSYLMEGLNHAFPGRDIALKQCLASFAGVRPVFGQGILKPSSESRDHTTWVENGLVTVTGGKLTTFRRLGLDALRAAQPFLPFRAAGTRIGRLFAPASDRPTEDLPVSPASWRRLCGRYGDRSRDVIQGAGVDDLTPIPGTKTLWAELFHAARHEEIRHLSDLLLRRVRIGLLTPKGGARHLDRIQELCVPALPWDAAHWEMERKAYQDLWRRSYGVPGQD